MHRAEETAESERGEKRFRVTTDGARLSRFDINPLWLTSMVEIKAAICLKRLNNVRHSVKHTPAALYIMHRRPAEGLQRKDNMTYPRERWRDGRRESKRERRQAGRHLKRKRGWRQRRKWEGQRWGFNKSLSPTVRSWLRGGGGGGHSKGPEGYSHNSH